MQDTERRRFRRLKLRLAVTRLTGELPGSPGVLWTSDISSGGMYFVLDRPDAPPVGARVAFELAVPPGEGYSSSSGLVKGTGQVVRTAGLDAALAGVAVRFTQPLSVEF
jgi:hypothetical protein